MRTAHEEGEEHNEQAPRIGNHQVAEAGAYKPVFQNIIAFTKEIRTCFNCIRVVHEINYVGSAYSASLYLQKRVIRLSNT